MPPKAKTLVKKRKVSKTTTADLVRPTNVKPPPRAKSTLPLTDIGTPEEKAVVPDPPKSLGAPGVAKWYQLGKSLATRNLLSEHFLPALEHCCQLYDQLDAINVELNGGLMIMTAWGLKQHPLAITRNHLMGLIRAALTDFGMTPTSTRGSSAATGAEPASKEGQGVPRRDRKAVPKQAGS